MSFVVVLLLLSVLTNTISQLSLKRGIMTVKGVNFRQPATVVRVLRNVFILVWLVLLIPSMLLWLKAISMVDLSFAYPFLSLNMVFISMGSVAFLKERVTTKQWSGIILILVGIILISQS
jgi:drug/metabolite transporter (DMT)-like permease